MSNWALNEVVDIVAFITVISRVYTSFVITSLQYRTHLVTPNTKILFTAHCWLLFWWNAVLRPVLFPYIPVFFSTDVNEVFSRLFDHRPFLRGEIEYFKKEFEASHNIPVSVLHASFQPIVFSTTGDNYKCYKVHICEPLLCKTIEWRNTICVMIQGEFQSSWRFA